MSCPSANTMLDWAAGRQPTDAVHLSDCSHCRELVDALRSDTEADDAWLQLLPEALPSESEPALAADMVIAEHYRLVRLLGEGATGLVWQATTLENEQPVALKFLKARQPAHVRRLVREARIIAALRHRHIVEVLEVIDDGPVIVMELLEGEPLAALLERRGRLDVAEAVSIALDVAGAIEAAHDKGVVHRDLKPENVFVVGGSSPHVKVLDFGTAKILDRSILGATTTSITRTGALVGTPCYMAPEQLFGDSDVDARADIWALGAVLYECLAGTRPVQGDHLGQIFKRIALGEIAPLASLAPDVPRRLQVLVTRMLARDRSERPASMGEVIAKLRSLDASPRRTSRWLVAGACIAAVATVMGARPERAARVERVYQAPVVPVIEQQDKPDRERAAPRQALPPPAALRASKAPPAPKEAASTEAPERLPGGVLKTSPY